MLEYVMVVASAVAPAHIGQGMGASAPFVLENRQPYAELATCEAAVTGIAMPEGMRLVCLPVETGEQMLAAHF